MGVLVCSESKTVHQTMEFAGLDINSLSSLLNQSQSNVNDESAQQTQQPPMTLGSTKVVFGNQTTSSSSTKPTFSSRSIWQEDEIPTEEEILSVSDDRISPRYEFSYKQEIGTEDSFLNMNGKTPGSVDCSHLVSLLIFLIQNFLY